MYEMLNNPGTKNFKVFIDVSKYHIYSLKYQFHFDNNHKINVHNKYKLTICGQTF